jgi:hypothetical protein
VMIATSSRPAMNRRAKSPLRRAEFFPFLQRFQEEMDFHVLFPHDQRGLSRATLTLLCIKPKLRVVAGLV